MPGDYDVTYSDNRSTIVFKADLDAGWRELEKTYGFFRTLWIWYRDWHVRTQLAVIAQPATFDERAQQFPDVSLQDRDGLVSYLVDQRKLTVRVPLSVTLPWRLTPSQNPEIFLEKLPLVVHDFNLSPGVNLSLAFDLRVWIIFHQPQPAPIPDVRVWCQKFFVPAGQFESKRSRH
jgi:hypothetical protein